MDKKYKNNRSPSGNISLNKEEDMDKKLVVLSTHISTENGRTVVPALDGSIKSAETTGAFTDGIKCLTNEPPDGGLRAWSIMVGSFLINGVLFSIINTYSLIYLELQKRLMDSGQTEVSSKADEITEPIVRRRKASGH